MRTLLDVRYSVETVKTLRFFLVVVVVTGPVASALGATVKSFITVKVDGFSVKWIQWFVGDVSIVLSACVFKVQGAPKKKKKKEKSCTRCVVVFFLCHDENSFKVTLGLFVRAMDDLVTECWTMERT